MYIDLQSNLEETEEVNFHFPFDSIPFSNHNSRRGDPLLPGEYGLWHGDRRLARLLPGKFILRTFLQSLTYLCFDANSKMLKCNQFGILPLEGCALLSLDNFGNAPISVQKQSLNARVQNLRPIFPQLVIGSFFFFG